MLLKCKGLKKIIDAESPGKKMCCCASCKGCRLQRAAPHESIPTTYLRAGPAVAEPAPGTYGILIAP